MPDRPCNTADKIPDIELHDFFGGDVPDIRFSSLGHTALWANANESSQTLISYLAEPDIKDSSVTNLVRRESRRLSNDQWEQEKAEYDVLIRDIEGVKFEFWDWQKKEWDERWDTTAADGQKNRLPTRVRITPSRPPNWASGPQNHPRANVAVSIFGAGGAAIGLSARTREISIRLIR